MRRSELIRRRLQSPRRVRGVGCSTRLSPPKRQRYLARTVNLTHSDRPFTREKFDNNFRHKNDENQKEGPSFYPDMPCVGLCPLSLDRSLAASSLLRHVRTGLPPAIRPRHVLHNSFRPQHRRGDWKIPRRRRHEIRYSSRVLP